MLTGCRLSGTFEPSPCDRLALTASRFAPGIMVMQAATVFVPCVILFQSLKNQRYIAAALKEWEHRNRRGDKTSFSGMIGTRRSTLTTSTQSNRRHEMYSKESFEKYLAGDDPGLLDFAVHREFTGENVNFLLCIREWKAAWAAVLDDNPDYDWERDPRGHRRILFEVGVKIFVDLVEVASAEFPINIEAPVLTSLRRTFADAARCLDAHPTVNVAAPFLQEMAPPHALGDSTLELVRRETNYSCSTEVRPWRQDTCLRMHRSIMAARLPLPDTIAVPRDFAVTVFDRAEESVRTMVLQKTWPRFVETCLSSAKGEDVEKGLFGNQNGAQVCISSS